MKSNVARARFGLAATFVGAMACSVVLLFPGGAVSDVLDGSVANDGADGSVASTIDRSWDVDASVPAQVECSTLTHEKMMKVRIAAANVTRAVSPTSSRVGEGLGGLARAPEIEATANLSHEKTESEWFLARLGGFQRCLPDYCKGDPAYRSCVVTVGAAQALAQCERFHQECVDRNSAPLTQASAAITARNAAIDAELQCRASAQCMAARAKAHEMKAIADALESVCFAVQQRAQTVAAIAAERANPTGVVDLATLHSLGQTLQGIDAALPGLKAEYTRVAHKPFAASACP